MEEETWRSHLEGAERLNGGVRVRGRDLRVTFGSLAESHLPSISISYLAKLTTTSYTRMQFRSDNEMKLVKGQLNVLDV